VSLDLLGVGALALVVAEWLGLGWLSGISFPSSASSAAQDAWCERSGLWALRLLVGAFLVALAQLLFALLGTGFTLIPAVLLVAAAGALSTRLALRSARQPSCSASSASAATSRRERLGWWLLAALLVAALARAVVVPESGWDAYSHWGLRAQAFASAGTLVDAHSEHEYYPPLVPLLEAWLYLHRGQVSIDLAKSIWALVGGAFAVCLAWHLRASLRAGAAWLAPYLAAAIVLATPGLLDGFWTGQADLALTAYLSLATLAVWQWHQAADRRWLVQAGIFGAAAALTKFEGLPRIGLVALALIAEAALARTWRVWPPLLALVVPALSAWLLWTAFELTHAIAPNAEHVGAFQPLAIGSVVVALLAVFGGVRNGGGVLIAAAAWALSIREVLSPPLRMLCIVVVVQALGTLIAFLVSSTAPDVEVLTSATRLVEQFLPIALFVGALGLARTGHL
jgi:hypothetical protein